jgi:hypothetical protein
MDKKSRDFTNNLGVSKSKHLALRKTEFSIRIKNWCNYGEKKAKKDYF